MYVRGMMSQSCQYQAFEMLKVLEKEIPESLRKNMVDLTDDEWTNYVSVIHLAGLLNLSLIHAVGKFPKIKSDEDLAKKVKSQGNQEEANLVLQKHKDLVEGFLRSNGCEPTEIQKTKKKVASYLTHFFSMKRNYSDRRPRGNSQIKGPSSNINAIPVPMQGAGPSKSFDAAFDVATLTVGTFALPWLLTFTYDLCEKDPDPSLSTFYYNTQEGIQDLKDLIVLLKTYEQKCENNQDSEVKEWLNMLD